MYSVPASTPAQILRTLLIGKKYDTKNHLGNRNEAHPKSPVYSTNTQASYSNSERVYPPVYELDTQPISQTVPPQPPLIAPLSGTKTKLHPKRHSKEEWIPSEAVVSDVDQYNHIILQNSSYRNVRGLPPLVNQHGELIYNRSSPSKKQVFKSRKIKSRNSTPGSATTLPMLDSNGRTYLIREHSNNSSKNPNKIRTRGVTRSGALYAVSAHIPTRARSQGQKPSLGIYNLIDIQLLPRTQNESKDGPFQKTLATLDESNDTKCMLRPWSSKHSLGDTIIKNNLFSSIASSIDFSLRSSSIEQQYSDASGRTSSLSNHGQNKHMTKNLTLHKPRSDWSPSKEIGDNRRTSGRNSSSTKEDHAGTEYNTKLNGTNRVQGGEDPGKGMNSKERLLNEMVTSNDRFAAEKIGPKKINAEDKQESTDLRRDKSVKVDGCAHEKNEQENDTTGITAHVMVNAIDSLRQETPMADIDMKVTWHLQDQTHIPENFAQNWTPLAPVVGRKIPQDKPKITVPPGHSIVKTAWFRPQVGESVLERLIKPPPRLQVIRKKISTREGEPAEADRSPSVHRSKRRKHQIYRERRREKKETLKCSTINIQLGGGEEEIDAMGSLAVQDIRSLPTDKGENTGPEIKETDLAPEHKTEKESSSAAAAQMSKFVGWNDARSEIGANSEANKDQQLKSYYDERQTQINCEDSSVQSSAAQASAETGLILDKASGSVVSLTEIARSQQVAFGEYEIQVCRECNVQMDSNVDVGPSTKFSECEGQRRTPDDQGFESKEVHTNVKVSEGAMSPWDSLETGSYMDGVSMRECSETGAAFISHTAYECANNPNEEMAIPCCSGTETFSSSTMTASCDKVSSVLSTSEEELPSVSCRLRISKSDDELHNKVWRRERTKDWKGSDSAGVSDQSSDTRRHKPPSKLLPPSDSRVQFLSESEAEHCHPTTPVPDNYESHYDLRKSMSLPLLYDSPFYKETKKLQVGCGRDVHRKFPKTSSKKSFTVPGSSIDISSELVSVPILSNVKTTHAEPCNEKVVSSEESSEDDIVVFTDAEGRHLFESRKKEELECSSSLNSTTASKCISLENIGGGEGRKSAQQEHNLSEQVSVPYDPFVYDPEVAGNRNELEEKRSSKPKFLMYYAMNEMQNELRPMKSSQWETQISRISQHPLLKMDRFVGQRVLSKPVSYRPPLQEAGGSQTDVNRNFIGQPVSAGFPMSHWEKLRGWQERGHDPEDEGREFESPTSLHDPPKLNAHPITSKQLDELLDMRRSNAVLNPAIGKCRMYIKGSRISQAQSSFRGTSHVTSRGQAVQYGICKDCKAMEKFLEYRAKAISESLQARQRDELDDDMGARDVEHWHTSDGFLDKI